MTAPAAFLSVVDGADHDLFAHYVNRNDALRARVDGIPCVALCGKRWVPSRLPELFPVCPTCAGLFERGAR